MEIRSAGPHDRDALYDICIRTADAGGDGCHLYADHELPGHMWAGAYLALQPELAFVIDDRDGPAGYILGALDTAAFEDRLESYWWPALRKRYPDPVGVPRSARTRDQQIHHSIHRPIRTPQAPIANHPSHLHIDLLPQAQGRGYGAAMMDALLEALRAHGSPGVHLGVSPANVRAVRFYRHLGFSTLADYGDHGLLLGLTL